MSLAENVKKLSKDRGLNITELSKQANIPKRTVHAIWTGESKDPKLSNVIKIAIALGTSTDELIFDDEVKDDLKTIFRELQSLNKQQKEYAKKVLRAVVIQAKNEQLNT